MALDILSQPTAPARLAPVEVRYAPLFCFSLLTAACALASFVFACATPFAAFAVLAAALLPLQPALVVVGAAWLVNQAIGFGLRGYPADIHTIMWGLAIGAAALIATATSALVLHTLPRTRDPAAFAFALIAAYAAYEVVLFAVTPFLGGAGAFTAAIVGRLSLLSALWLIGLIAACEALRLFNSVRWRQMIP
ncbi:MAG TPA: hypothetical protein VIH98_02100 [Xanthobacteraceae bacterium]|jgi:hypothetical protein